MKDFSMTKDEMICILENSENPWNEVTPRIYQLIRDKYGSFNRLLKLMHILEEAKRLDLSGKLLDEVGKFRESAIDELLLHYGSETALRTSYRHTRNYCKKLGIDPTMLRKDRLFIMEWDFVQFYWHIYHDYGCNMPTEAGIALQDKNYQSDKLKDVLPHTKELYSKLLCSLDLSARQYQKYLQDFDNATFYWAYKSSDNTYEITASIMVRLKALYNDSLSAKKAKAKGTLLQALQVHKFYQDPFAECEFDDVLWNSIETQLNMEIRKKWIPKIKQSALKRTISKGKKKKLGILGRRYKLISFQSKKSKSSLLTLHNFPIRNAFSSPEFTRR